MTILTITLAVLIGVGVLAYFWTKILGFLNGWLRTRLESKFGTEKCDGYVKFILWLDGKVTLARKQIINGYRWFRENVLRIKETYHKTGSGYVKTTETILAGNGVNEAPQRVVTEETIPWEELPAPVREAMVRQNTEEAEMDVMDIIADRTKEKLTMTT